MSSQKAVSVGLAAKGRCGLEPLFVMSASLPPFAWQRVAPALRVACAGSAVAAGRPRPSAEPLWKVYPLDTGEPTSAGHPAGATGGHHDDATRAAGSPRAGLAPLAVVTVFYAVIVGLVVSVAGLALRYVRRRRLRESVTCEISWSEGGHGGAFRATVLAGGDKPRLVAESRPLEGRPPVLPDEGARSYDAYASLVSQGLEPFDRGRDWRAVRLRRIPSAGPPSGVLRG
jgi:hypothetical protein